MLCRLNNPTATLYGFDQNGTDHSILVTLSSPMTDVDSKVRMTGHWHGASLPPYCVKGDTLLFLSPYQALLQRPWLLTFMLMCYFQDIGACPSLCG